MVTSFRDILTLTLNCNVKKVNSLALCSYSLLSLNLFSQTRTLF